MEESMFGGITFYIEIILIAIVICLQVSSFIKTKSKISDLKGVFGNIDKLGLRSFSVNSEIVKTKKRLRQFLQSLDSYKVPPTEDSEDSAHYIKLSLLYARDAPNKGFSTILYRTNEYLCKNTGTSAEISVLEDICNSQKEALEDEIHNSLNTPLYLGLAGTFVGIIVGLGGIDFQQIFESGNGLSGLQNLLYGVMLAMLASLLGLGLTLWNSAVSYSSAVTCSNNGKDEYLSFLRRELMPLLSKSMAHSLESLKSVLGHFVDKFGQNLDAYADSAELLNDNLEKQHLVLQEINQLDLTKTANKIAETFLQLKQSSDSLSVFQTYQSNLNETIANASKMVNSIETLFQKFDEFASGLAMVVENQNRNSDLQREFKDAIITHFPTGSEARDVWRKEFDLLISEGKEVSNSLQEQLTASTEYICTFVSNNREFFDTFKHLKEVMGILEQNSDLQVQCYNDLKKELIELRKDQKDTQLETLELHKSTLIAIESISGLLRTKNINNGSGER